MPHGAIDMDEISPVRFSQEAVARTLKRGTPTDDELEELGEKIAEKWEKLGRRLEVSDPKLEEINQARDQLSEKGYRMLKHWKQAKGSSATYEALCDALKHKLVQRKDLAEQFCYINGPFATQQPADPVPEGRVTGEVPGATAESPTMGSLRGETLTLKSRVQTVTVNWKQGSFIGFGGDRSQNYVLCDYNTSNGDSVPVYIQGGYDIPQRLKIDSRLQYGTQDVLFFVYHDKSQTPYQERFRCNGLQQFVYAANTVLKMAKGIDISWAVGNYLVDV